MIGAIIRQGPHHGAQQSSKTGADAPSTSDENDASVTVTGLPPDEPAGTGNGSPHFPQTGCASRARL
jgi:hypothetical protein